MGEQPSVFDLNADGSTNLLDLLCVLVNFGNVCSADDTGVMCPGINGACWIDADSTCMIVTEAECFTLGGSYQGDGKIHCCPCVDPTDTINCPQCPPLDPPGG